METQTPPHIPSEVRGYAARAHLTQSDLAGILGLSRMSVSRRMNGKVRFSTDELTSLATAFGVPVASFFAPERAA